MKNTFFLNISILTCIDFFGKSWSLAHARKRTYTHPCIRTDARTHPPSLHTRARAHTHARAHANMHTHTRTHTHPRMHAHTRVHTLFVTSNSMTSWLSITKNVKFHDLAGDSLKCILWYTSEAKMQSSKNNISCFTNLQNDLLVLIFVWFPRLL